VQSHRNYGGFGNGKATTVVQNRRKGSALTQKSSILTQISPHFIGFVTIFAL